LRRLFLHVGSPKCGSTYLQRVLLNNQDKLLKHRVAYPHDGGVHPGNASNLETFTPEKIEHLFAEADTIFLSHEDLFARSALAKSLATACLEKGVQVQVIVFLRPFSEFIFGDYSQFLKQYFETFLRNRTAFDGRNFEQFAVDRARNLNIVGYLKGWRSMFPESPITLGKQKEIRNVIEPLINVPHLSWDVRREHANPSLRMFDCDCIVKAINDKNIPKADVTNLFKQAFHNTQEHDLGKSTSRISWIEALFAHQNEKLLLEFGFDNRRLI